MPTSLPKLMEADVRAITDSGSFSRGQEYFRNNQIINGQVQGMVLKSQALGTDTYRVKVTLNQHGIDVTSCSCPVGGLCKHVVALLLTWIHRPQEFQEIAELRNTLDQRSKEQLIDLILLLIDRAPELEPLLGLPVVGKTPSKTKIEPAALLRQMTGRSRRGRYDDDEYGGGYDRAEPVIELGEQYAKTQDWGNAITVFATVAKELTDDYEEYADHEGGLGDTLGRCIEGLGQCLDQSGDADDRADALQALFDVYIWDLRQGGIGESDGVTEQILAVVTPEEKALVAGWVKAALPSFNSSYSDWAKRALGQFLLSLQMDELNDEEYIRICRETNRYSELLNRLFQLGRVAEALKEAEKISDYELLQIASIFATHHQTDALRPLFHTRWQKGKDQRVGDWLKKDALERKDFTTALSIAESLFALGPAVARYVEMKNDFGKMSEWEALRTRLYQYVQEKRETNTRIEMHLQDEEFDQAIAVLNAATQKQTGYWGIGDTMLVHVADVVQSARPHEAIALYLKAANIQIGARNRTNYATAATYLAKVKKIYQSLNQLNAWQKTVDKIREDNRTLRALLDELRRAGL